MPLRPPLALRLDPVVQLKSSRESCRRPLPPSQAACSGTGTSDSHAPGRTRGPWAGEVPELRPSAAPQRHCVPSHLCEGATGAWMGDPGPPLGARAARVFILWQLRAAGWMEPGGLSALTATRNCSGGTFTTWGWQGWRLPCWAPLPCLTTQSTASDRRPWDGHQEPVT